MSELTGTDRPLWRDYSRHQGKIDFTVAQNNGVLGMATRATISWGYKDPKFAYNYEKAGYSGMYRTSYHVLYPGEDVIRQLDNWYEAHPEIDVIPRVIDLELEHSVSPAQIAHQVAQMSDIINQRDGVNPIIYSRKNLIDAWLATWDTGLLNDHYFWLAQYLTDSTKEHQGPPALPNNLSPENVVLHQTNDRIAGFPGEVESASVDWDRWEWGNEDYMHKMIQELWGGQDPPPPPLPDGELEGRVDTLETDVAELKLHEHDDAGEHAHHLETTHRVVTSRSNGEKLRAVPNGSEAAMLKNGHRVRFLNQTRAGGNKLVAAEVNGVVVTGWMHEDNIKKV